MKCRNRNFFLIALVFAAVILAASYISAKENVSMAEFVKMSFEERVEICARLVSSDRIGDCASISQPEGELLTVADIKKIGEPCFTGGITDSMTIGSCVREKLDAQGVPANFPGREHITRAHQICSGIVNSSEIGSCTAALCTRLENKAP